MQKKLWSLILLGLIAGATLAYAAQTDDRIRNGQGASYISPTDAMGNAITPELTYSNGYFHQEIGTFNSMWRDTLNTISATVDTMILPAGASRAFPLKNNSSSKTAEFWLDTDAPGSKHGFIKPGVSRYIPCSGSTLFVKQATTVPDIEIEFGK